MACFVLEAKSRARSSLLGKFRFDSSHLGTKIESGSERCSIDILKFFNEKHRPENWTDETVLDGKLYRYVDTGITLPLIEIREGDLSRLEGYEFYEPYWVVAQPPTIFAIYDREDTMIYSSFGFAPGYNLDLLVQADGYESAADFREKFKASTKNPPLTDLDIWIRMGLPAKVYLPSLKKRTSETPQG